MIELLEKQKRVRPTTSQSSTPPKEAGRMYAIAFDMDTDTLQRTYGSSYNNAYGEIKKCLVDQHNFRWQQGSLYFGDNRMNAVTCVLAVMDLASRFPWFAPSVKDIRMLRIEEYNDLMPAVQQAASSDRRSG